MRHGRRLGVATAAAWLTMSLAGAPARADMTKDQCIDANGKGQDLAHDGKLTAARAQLQRCAATSCPAILRRDCTKRLDALDQVQPTIVFELKDTKGDDVSDATVTMDGEPLAIRSIGAAVSVDPGSHKFAFESPGRIRVEKTLVLREGERDRRELVVLPQPGPAPAPPPPVVVGPAMPATPPAPERSGTSTVRVLGLVSGGVGVVGVAIGTIFGLKTGSAWNAQKTDCPSATSCPNHAQAVSDHSTMSTDSTISTVAFAGGGALLALGVTMFLLGGSHAESTTGLVVSPAFAPGWAGLSAHGGF